MKLIITSTDALFDKEKQEFFPGSLEALQYFKSLSSDHKVVVISNHAETLEVIPEGIYTLNLSEIKWIRKSPKLIEYISTKLNILFEDIIVLGSKDDDMILAANARILLLTADYAKKNNPDDRIYSEGYGIGILSIDRLYYFFDHYLNIATPWFFSHSIDESFKLFGLTNAMTGQMRDRTEIEICNHLRSHLKAGYEKGKSPFRIYSLLSLYRIFKEIRDINYWACYPSSSGEPNEALISIKEVLRKSFGSRTTQDLLIRHKPSVKRNMLSAGSRVSDGCDSQFDSIHLNPYYKGKIKGKNFCIIDDFSTHGTSSETVRHLLQHEGANKVIFIALGKFKLTYKMYDYSLSGDLYAPAYKYTKNGIYKEISGVINNSGSEELLDSLKDAFL
ncbi:phosphoribosyltransferase [Flavobacterium nitrogenifigens]|uniref:Phosphoribosyl transferase domain-containing protein n=1 Tax=Flavobacterium nitrogenifigens TaxID=1617283 RepID=A0A521AFP9_9FLAO|nr:phosphoribosyltransferase [Flavobacterium nitrogenifigens]KAF2331496.1 phosphoribosyltransferase [Flavobacterium nitrogenifigens]SMO33622.1 hypothetical protein SAMN06265220_10195 [Flavobacterium nitrogenifigens]